MTGRKRERGMVLLLVLVIVALLTSLLTEFVFSTLVSMRLTETFRDSTRAYYLAKGGLQAARMILRDDANGYDAGNELWAQPISGYPVGDGQVSIRIEDLNGRLDLNRLVTAGGNPDTVMRDRYLHLLENLAAEDPQALTDALIDWLDADTDPHPRGAETSYYQGLEPPYPCKNGTLDTLEELALVKGYDSDVRRLLLPHVTVHGNERVNVNTAGVEVLAALFEGGAVKSAEALAAARKVMELRVDGPIRNLETLKPLKEMENLGYVINTYLSVSSANFLIRAGAGVNDGVRTVEGVVRRTGSGADQLLYQKVY